MRFLDYRTHANILSQYTPASAATGLSGAAPETREAILADKRSKMLTMWVTEDEHRRLLERCDGKQLAAWMRQTCLDEKPARAGKLPSISPALLRQLAGMGNNLNQIARQVNAGGSSGLDRVQVVAALMAIDAGLERLRHAVLEKGADDDR